MKKSRKLLCVLLALVMVVSLLPVMAFAADEDVAAEETTAATVEETSRRLRASLAMSSRICSPNCRTIWLL